jgi:hypothetical protein
MCRFALRHPALRSFWWNEDGETWTPKLNERTTYASQDEAHDAGEMSMIRDGFVIVAI